MPHTLALLMPGVRNERMRACEIDLPKPLVPVDGLRRWTEQGQP